MVSGSGARAPERWEMGSLFHAAPVPEGTPGGAPWEGRPHALVGSGRDAFRLLLESHRPRRVWAPTYLCQEVVAAMGSSASEVRLYPDGPLDPADASPWEGLEPGDLVLTVAYFGVRAPLRPGGGSSGVAREELLVVEDHTHGPCGSWARASRADYCLASLRKLWPLPDGGVLWSPTEREVPEAPPCRPELERASGIKLAGMELKARYLRGEAVEKPLFRELLDRGEGALHGAVTSGITPWSRSLLAALPLGAMEEARRRRHRRLVEALPEGPGYRVLGPEEEDAVPFTALVVFDDPARRDRVHRALVEERVYASRLWPLDRPVLPGVRDADVALSRASFSLPLDMRYDDADVDRAAAALRDALGRAS